MQHIKYILVTLLIVLAYIGGFFTHKKVAKPVILQSETKVDTITKWRTIVEEKPVYRTSRVADTMVVYVDSSRFIHRQDSTFVALPKTTKTYGNDYYSLAVSGYNPTLDYIKLNIPTKIVRDPIKMNHISVGVSAIYLDRFYAPITVKYEYGNDWRFGGEMGFEPITRNPIIKLSGSWQFGW